MEHNVYIERYRRESTILNGNQNSSVLNQPLIPGNISNLNSHLLQLIGGGKGSSHPGQYLAPGNKWVPGRIPWLKEQISDLEKKFDKHCQEQLLIGNPRPKAWPQDLQGEKDKLEARLAVAKEEIFWLEQKLQEAQEQQQKARPSLLMAPQHWGSGSLRDGVLVEIGPWKVAMHPEKKVLCIMDESSPYNGLEVHRFRSQVTNPMGLEFAYRNKREETEAVRLQRSRKKVNWPEAPTWDPKTDLIEYSDYSNETIKKLKKEN